MGRQECPSKAHFARCETRVAGRPLKVTWKCDHCGEHVISGKYFKAVYARIHLAAESSNGLCANLCEATDDHAQGRRDQFRKLIKSLKDKKARLSRKRKQQDMRLAQRHRDAATTVAKKKKQTQPKLQDLLKASESSAADFATAQWAIAHDIPANALSGIYWKNLTKKLSAVSPSYKPMNPQKLKKDMVPLLKKMAEQEQRAHLSHQPDAGRTVTGDGATKQVPLINFLVHVPDKGVTLLDVKDCSQHMAEGVTKDSL